MIVCTLFVFTRLYRKSHAIMMTMNNDYLIITMTIKIIVHTRYIGTVPKHFSVVHAQLYILFYFFPFRHRSGNITLRSTTHVISHDLTTFHEIISSKFYTCVSIDVWYTYILLLLFPIVVVLFVAFSWLCCAFCWRSSLMVLLQPIMLLFCIIIDVYYR